MKVILALALALLWQNNERVVTVPRAASTQPKASVSGLIVSETGEPLAGATVTLSRHFANVVEMLANDGALPVIAPSRTDQRGLFSFAAVDAAAYDLLAQMKGYVGTSKELTTNPGQRIEGFNMRMIRAAAISGRIWNSAGEPLAGTEVQLVQRVRAGILSVIETKSSGDGSYQLVDFLPGEYVLLAGTPTVLNGKQPGSFARSIVVSPGAIRLDISIDPRARHSLRGNLRMAVGPTPAESQLSWRLAVTQSGGRMARVAVPKVQYNAQNGDFAVSDLSPGYYQFEAQLAISSTVVNCGQAETLLSQADVNGLQITLQQCQ